MPNTRTLREQIDEIRNRPGPHNYLDDQQMIVAAADRWANEHTAAISTVVFDETLAGRSSGIDQGISRLAMLSFLAGEQSTAWNGKPGPHQWVRYRGHHVSRGDYPDGTRFSIQVRGHAGEVETRFEPTRNATGTERALVLLDDIDQLLDIVIDAHGVPGDEIPEAEEIVETIDSATAARVLDSYVTFSVSAVMSGQVLDQIREHYLRAIDRGEIQP